MAATLLITLRETLEASLVVGIVLAFLHRTRNERFDIVIWAAVASGILISLALAYSLHVFAGGLSPRAQEIQEGITMLLAAGLITWMVLWLAKTGRHMRQNIEDRVETHLQRGELFGLFSLTFLSVLREGAETVIFVRAAILQTQSGTEHIGIIAGFLIAISSAYLLFKGLMHWGGLRHFFSASGILLMLFAAGLIAHGIHELQEAAVIPTLLAPLWNTNGLLAESGTVGSLLKGLFGYNGNPSLLETTAYIVYLLLVMTLWMRRTSKAS